MRTADYQAFKADSVQYKDLQTPEDNEGKRRLLRSLMNIRMPRKLNDSVLAVQDEYLRERIRENYEMLRKINNRGAV